MKSFVFLRILYNRIMTQMILFFLSILIFLAIMAQKFTNRIKVPMLLGFIVLGLFIGNGNIASFRYENFELTEIVCSCALVIVMFYGGFGTNWKAAKNQAVVAGALASIGVLLTAMITGLFCVFVLGLEPLIGFLIGALISSTDAASVFSILRTSNLSLKYHTDSLLEVESGSNDPMSYMLVMILLTMMKDGMTFESIVITLLVQVGVGFLIGWLIFYLAKLVLMYVDLEIAGFLTIFVLACAFASFSLASMLKGNGYLAVYITGILMGNAKLGNKKELVHFFDGLSALMQIVLFFILGLLAQPEKIIALLPISFAVFLILSFVSRPISVFGIMLFDKRAHFNQMLMVSFAGLRGAASIVFAIMAMVDEATFGMDVFHLVFGVVLFSILIQGTLLPWVARKLDMVDLEGNVLKTFTDYDEEGQLSFIEVFLERGSRLHGLAIESLRLPSGLAIAIVERKGKKIVPTGKLVLQELDRLVFVGRGMEQSSTLLDQEVIEKGDGRIGKILETLHEEIRPIVFIGRNGQYIVPSGVTILEENDILVYVKS